MSYCRWSSDDFTSDLYIYGAVDGISLHIAANRRVDHEMPPDVPIDEVEAWVARCMAVLDIVKDLPLVPIELPHAGESWYGLSCGEAADKVEYLIGLGYRVPKGVVEALREDAREAAAQERP